MLDRYDCLQQVVAKYPKISLGYKGQNIPPLLDSGSNVTLIYLSFLYKKVSHLMSTHIGKKSEVHTSFHLTEVNDRQLPIKMHVELNLDFIVPRV